MKIYYLLVILVSAFSWRPIFPSFGGEILTLLRAFLLIFTIFLIFRKGIKFNFITKFSLTSTFILTLYFIFQILNITNVDYANISDMLRAYSAYLLILLSLCIRITDDELAQLVKIIIYLPLISVIGGVLFTLIADWNVLKFEYTGVIRLQGSNPPAHLAELSLVSVLTGLIVNIIKNSKKKLAINLMMNNFFLVINLIILIATFTRITILATLIVFVYYVLTVIIEKLKNNKFNLLQLSSIVVLSIPALIVFILALNMLIMRSSVNESGGINTSGRYWAWKYFLEKSMEHPIIGRGLGASNSLYDYNPHKEFVAPHNEYIRVFLEVGYIGAAISVMFFIIFISRYLRLSFNKNILSIKWVIILLISIGLVAYYDNLLVTVHFSMPFTVLLICAINYSEGMVKT